MTIQTSQALGGYYGQAKRFNHPDVEERRRDLNTARVIEYVEKHCSDQVVPFTKEQILSVVRALRRVGK